LVTLQVTANIFAITNIWLLANSYVWWGCVIGLPGQLIWLYIFWRKNLKILMLTDVILVGIYSQTLWKLAYELK